MRAMKLQRREFLHRTALGVGGLIVAAPQVGRAPAPPPASFDPYALVPLGRTPLKVSRFCLGTGMSGGMRAVESHAPRQGEVRGA